MPNLTSLTGAEFLRVGDVAKQFLIIGKTQTPPEFIIFIGGVGAGQMGIAANGGKWG